ncbi:hypothetical protein LCGC14_0624360 [marine sediment metagenome]|uniref:Portal protein n=1 Tax=marine sediment metagenome TaxID=412755 RepID=A0A0F9R406_9ZZZZ
MPAAAVDPVGRAIDDEAQKAYDAKLHTPEQNLADNPALVKRAVEQVGSFIRDTESARTLLDDKMAVLYNLWNGDPFSRYFPSSSSVHVPEPFKAVESFVTRMVSILIGKPNWFRVVGVDGSGKKNAKVIKELIETELRTDGFNSKIARFMRSTAIYGWCPGKVRWKFRRRKVKYNRLIEEPATEKGTRTGTKVRYEQAEETINLDGPTVDYTDVYDFFTDLRYHDHQEGPGVVFRHEVPESELLEMGERGIYMHTDALIKGDKSGGSAAFSAGSSTMPYNTTSFREMRDGADGLGYELGPGRQRTTARIYELYEFWGRFDASEDDKDWKPEDEYVITMARKMAQGEQNKGWTCLRIAKNPWWHGRRPAIVAHYIRRSHAFQSVGVIEPIVRLCAELDDSRNMGLAARALATKPVFEAGDGADIHSNQLVLNPGDIIRTREVGSIKPLHVPDRSDVAWKAEAVIKADIQETTAMPKLFSGVAEGKETATATVGRTREANKRIAEVARNVAEHFLIPMLEMFHSMNQQMITEERMIEILGEDGLVADIRKTGPAEIAGRVHFEVEVLPQIELAGIDAQMRTGFLNAAAPYIQMDPGMLNVEMMLRKTYEAQFGVGDSEEMFPRTSAPKYMRNVYEEHVLMSHGHVLKPQDGEKYFIHMQGHMTFIRTRAYAAWDEDSKRRMRAHVENTRIAAQTEMEQTVLPQGPPGMGPVAPQGAPGAAGPAQPARPRAAGGAPPPARRPMPRAGASRAGTPEGIIRGNAASNEPRVRAGMGA